MLFGWLLSVRQVVFFCFIFVLYARSVLDLKCSRLKTLVVRCFLKSNFQLEVFSVKEQRDFALIIRRLSKVSFDDKVDNQTTIDRADEPDQGNNSPL